jgi:hypothetical protein
MPVTLPLGRARLATRPTRTGSPTPIMTMGMVAVASLAAYVAAVPYCHSWRRNRLPAMADSRQKAKADLFDRRFAVFESERNLLQTFNCTATRHKRRSKNVNGLSVQDHDPCGKRRWHRWL